MDRKMLLAAVVLAFVAATAVAQGHNKIVSCYYSSWAFYRPGDGKFDVDDIDPFLCTHGFYGFADMDNQTWEVYAIDGWFDLAPSDCPGTCNYDGYRRFVALKQINPNFHPMLSIGGWNAGSGKFSAMARDPIKRITFVDSVVAFLDKFGFDGVDFDWEYPGIREGSDPNVDKENFATLAMEFSNALRPRGKLFTCALGAGYDKIQVAYDIPTIAPYFDFFNIMTYDFHGAWDNFTGHNAPMYHRDEEYFETHPGYRYNVFDSVELYLDLGLAPSKMVLGMPAYGRGVTLVDPEVNGLYCPAYMGFPMGWITRQRGILGYNEIVNIDQHQYLPEATPGGWTVVVDDCYMSPYMFNGPYWMSYDDPDSLAYKVRYANLRGLAGAMIWSIETDDFRGSPPFPLLTRINAELAGGQTYNPSKTCGTAPMCEAPPKPLP